jgi:hypothetical protein
MKKVSYEDVLFAGTQNQDFCASFYASNFMELERLIDEARLVARQDLNPEQFSALFGSIEADKNLIDTFPVAVFLSGHTKMYVPLFKCDEELFVVSTSFHIKPLIKIHQRNKDIAMLVFTDSHVKLFQVSMKNLVLLEIFKVPESEPDYLKIDQFVTSILAKRKLLLVFTGNLEQINRFKSVSFYGYSYKEPLLISQKLKSGELLRHIFRHIEPFFRGQEAKISARFLSAKLQGKMVSQTEDIFNHARRGEIKNLYIAEDKKIWGYIDTQRKKISTHLKQVDSYDDDILDDLSELVIKNKGTVIVVPQSEMPENMVIFGILRDNYERIIFEKKSHKSAKQS